MLATKLLRKKIARISKTTIARARLTDVIYTALLALDDMGDEFVNKLRLRGSGKNTGGLRVHQQRML